MKSKTITPQYEEITAEIRLKGDDKILKATLITYSGDLAQV